jgi:hypothetical protein
LWGEWLVGALREPERAVIAHSSPEPSAAGAERALVGDKGRTLATWA